MLNEDAKKKWCPMVRFILNSDSAVITNRETNASGTFCIADECALWVKSEVEVNHGWCGLTQEWR